MSGGMQPLTLCVTSQPDAERPERRYHARVGTISGLKHADGSYAPRGNAAQDAPRPLLNVAQMRAQAPALSTSCVRLTESAICAICDALRHTLLPDAERGYDQQVVQRL